MKTNDVFALIVAALIIAGCSTLTTEDVKDTSGIIQKDTTSNTIDLLSTSPWTINLFNKDWTMISGAFKKLPLENGLVEVKADMVKASYYALQSELPSGTFGAFDSLTIEYKSNYRFQMTVATAGDKSGWENMKLAPRSELEYSSFTYYGKDFVQTWTGKGEETLKISSAKIVAFANNDNEVLVDGPLTMSIRKIKLYTKK